MEVKEFILRLKNGDTWRVYAEDKERARLTFANACVKYSNTDNEEYKKIWNSRLDEVVSNKVLIIENHDFHGVREVLDFS